ncbi:MAG: hypothetical protein ACJ796_09455 [Gemmatimonadaceae bacterium]
MTRTVVVQLDGIVEHLAFLPNAREARDAAFERLGDNEDALRDAVIQISRCDALRVVYMEDDGDSLEPSRDDEILIPPEVIQVQEAISLSRRSAHRRRTALALRIGVRCVISPTSPWMTST